MFTKLQSSSIFRMVILATTVIATGVAFACDNLNETLKLLATDGQAADEFARSVSISGTTAIVGVPADDDNGSFSGSAYLFNATTGVQIDKLLASDGAADDEFGFSVAISGGTALVGAYFDDGSGVYSGSAYLFDVTTGTQIAKLIPTDGAVSDNFGFAVAISGNTAIVGAPNDDDNGLNSGSAYLFDVTTGEQIGKLLSDDGASSDWFGRSVAIDGNTAIVGAYRDDDNGTSSGSAYIFDVAKEQQIFKLLAIDGEADDEFGRSIAISGTTAIIGAHRNDDGGTDSGSAYLFDVATGLQTAELLPSDGAANDRFGISVAIDGPTAVIGADGDDDSAPDSGAAYLFDVKKVQQISKLLASDGAGSDSFGSSVAISGSTVIVGAWKDDDNGLNSGCAYYFDLQRGNTCPADFDCDGTVATGDLLELLKLWGTCDDCPADFNGSGAVDTADLVYLLSVWGSCP